MLIETTLDTAGVTAAMIVGVGANLAVAPALPDRPTACLGDFLAPPSPETVARRVFGQFDYWMGRREAVRDAWLARAHPIGTALSVTTDDRTRTGAFAGLSADGHLLLDDGEAVRSVAAGRVH